ncbi:uncharacterized protein K460DRAFT_305386 [Cucurbitaria berberidis CBS 394.84]|uniref:Uncharacterized protein n=1 Tax=Cucurbitaria berberidis CBS 394.84 TaxID=1168544 RepID=A0A9P4GMV2_9PLEO|nr:uncharacterized protein K460DRAFT_305386 [Cucurbitaria berberidis CBS 394.84]KAF1849343.1 hypothetical protein K460DRAFT_305386 [Cucurbitaria berberidis CBS 394.84]
MVSSQTIDERKANLPLPEQPPVASDFNSADERTVNVGSGAVGPDISSGNSKGGREGHDGLSGIPNDAVTRDQKHHKGLEDTTGKDFGYPAKNDPSAGVKE